MSVGVYAELGMRAQGYAWGCMVGHGGEDPDVMWTAGRKASAGQSKPTQTSPAKTCVFG